MPAAFVTRRSPREVSHIMQEITPNVAIWQLPKACLLFIGSRISVSSTVQPCYRNEEQLYRHSARQLVMKPLMSCPANLSSTDSSPSKCMDRRENHFSFNICSAQ